MDLKELREIKEAIYKEHSKLIPEKCYSYNDIDELVRRILKKAGE
jgi:hypothetical protein